MVPLQHDKLELRDRLRRDTAACHRRLDALLPLAGPATPREADYRDHLRFLLGFHAPVEAAVQRVAGINAWLPDLDRRYKTEQLRRDLAEASAHTRQAGGYCPAPTTIAEAAGVLYVLEGATLGARTLIPKLRRAGVLSGRTGSRYVDGYGSDTARMWASFTTALNRLPADDHAAASAAAVASFAALCRWHAESHG